MSAIVRSNFHTFHLKWSCSVRAQGNTLEHQNSAWKFVLRVGRRGKVSVSKEEEEKENVTVKLRVLRT